MPASSPIALAEHQIRGGREALDAQVQLAELGGQHVLLARPLLDAVVSLYQGKAAPQLVGGMAGPAGSSVLLDAGKFIICVDLEIERSVPAGVAQRVIDQIGDGATDR